ncbi:MAG: trigger factor [Sarcina ventriculi]|uniref:Trigger factor n=1 Tax=Sarcina ventriculi TaxID=1267 RepID=A0ABM9UKN3_SARVE|nr:trigger factor [Sarcina ventriculi]MDO4403157.1 trigger factor [Clostridiaceae bacterium]MBU5321819.1 trigger factor [Sarcina ventriculi]MCI5635543.1 trigger factor [Sarcina ventriculi]MDD7373003.1 trigger factor [Sarcina ventriculi]MDY7063298.1 trigger factor [Sarcina ventriculi]
MEVKMNKIENNVVELEVKVESKKFDAALNKAYKKNVNKFNVQGFRKGKVPMAIVKKFYGVEVLFDDAINFCIDEAYPVALNENNVKPVDYPQIDVIEVGEGKDLVFKAKVTTYPEVKLGEYKGVEVSYTKPEVTDEQIENQLKDIQAKNARIETKTEGKVEDKNIAVIDFKGFIDGTPFEGGEGHDYDLEIGSGSFIGDFEQQLIGLEKGQSKDVNVTFPENYGREELNGKEAKFEVTVKDIKVKELPALDDEFAKEVSEFDTIAEYKADLKVKAEKANEERATRELQEKVIGQVVDNATIDLPQVMVDREVQNMIKDLEQRLSYQGLSLDQYFQFTGSSEEQMKDYMKENAERKVRTDLVLNAITDKENLEATEEELKAKAEEVVKMYQSKDVDQMVDILLKSQAEALKADVVREKIVNMLVDSAKVNK